jgi:hypothetical protein
VLLKRRVAFHVYPDSACRSVFRHRHARLSAHLWNFVRTCLHHLGKEGDAGWPRNPTPIKSQPTPRSDRYPCIVITGTLSGRISLPFCARSPQNVRHASSPHADRGGTRPWRPWRDDRGGTTVAGQTVAGQTECYRCLNRFIGSVNIPSVPPLFRARSSIGDSVFYLQ